MNTHATLRLGACLGAAVFATAFTQARVVGRLHTLGHATVRIDVTNGPILYLDPNTGIQGTPADADYVFLTHNHADHQNIAVLNRLRKAGTVFVTSPAGAPALMSSFPGATVHVVIPGMRLALGDLEVETVPMYNVIKSNHPRVMNFVGYVVNIGGVRVYHAGDTERFPEMKTFTTDVALLPLGQTFTMEAAPDAVAAALDLKARAALPIHWGMNEGTTADAELFVTQLQRRGLQALTVSPAGGFPLEVSETVAIAEHPASVTVPPDHPATLRVEATGSGPLRFQWRRHGLALEGATGAALSFPRAETTDAADYEVIVSDANGPVRSRLARLTVARPAPGRLVNLSVLTQTPGGPGRLIVGASVDGGRKPVLVRGLGPVLRAFGIESAVADPQLEIHALVNGSDTVVASNNNWGVGGAAGLSALRTAFVSVGAFGLGSGTSLDAALVTTFDGPRTIHVSDTAGRVGTTLVELYDLDSAGASRLTNLSARGYAGPGHDGLMLGFVISGNQPRRLLLRGMGPRLAAFGVTGALTNPRIELRLNEAGRTTLIAANDDWAEGGGAAPLRAAFAAAGAFALPDADSRDAAMVVTVPAGVFTALVTGAAGATGEAMIEVYDLP